MSTREVGIVMSGVTGRMGTNQHFVRSILAIMRDGGVEGADGRRIMPRPVLVGRSEERLRRLAEEVAPAEIGQTLPWTTDVEAAIRDDACEIVFDASSTLLRGRFADLAAEHGRAFYCEKPTATTLAEAQRIYERCRDAGIPHGVVQDKLFLPGIAALRRLRDDGFFGEILSVRGSFGYWVFTGHDPDQAPQRPSWNYRVEDGGGILVDMFCHWRYVLDHAIAPVEGVCAVARTELAERIDEAGSPYEATADDAAYAMFRLAGGVIAQFDSSWTTRVRRDDLLTIQIDGTEGSAVAGLRDCWTQSRLQTPRPVWNPDQPQPIDFAAGWDHHAPADDAPNAFRVQWEMFLRHVVDGEPFVHDLLDAARGVQLAECGHRSSNEGCWVDVEALAE